MKKATYLIAGLLCACSASLAHGQGQQQQQQPVALNPVFNDAGKSWLVTYGGDVENGNKRGDIAVQLQIQAVSGSDKNFTGTIYRYDNIKLIGNKVHYKKRSTANGKLTFDGQTMGWDPEKPRRPVRFKAERLYEDDNGDVRKLYLYGTYHSGADVNSQDKRKDDRLVVTLVDKLITPSGGGGGNGNGNGSGGEPTPATGETSTATVFIAHFATRLHPCEEEPDVDIMEEGEHEEEPPLP